MTPTLLTPSEIFKKKPSIQNFFTAQQLGILLFCGLVRGKRLSRGCYICLEDVEEMVAKKKAIKS